MTITIALFLLLAVLATEVSWYLDVNSTKEAIKRGTGSEANPVIAKIMQWFPTGWPWVKLAYTNLTVAGFFFGVNAYLGVTFATAAVIVIAAIFTLVALHNYDISK